MHLYKKVIKKLIEKKISISIAESCTGGLLSSRITSIPGVSKIYYAGLIVYSNESKKKLLKIPSKKISKFGAVSENTAREMLYGLYKLNKSKLCICTTGIAGPTGESIKKPLGLVFIGIKYKKKNFYN
tara:strand:+ start:263 stop:646 length:384 start_codon:yes stop_codon:yes gene_type:complete